MPRLHLQHVLRALAALALFGALVAALSAAAAGMPARAHQGRAADPAARTVVSFTWGGGFGDQMAALPLFGRYRMHATFYVPSGLVCRSGHGCAHSAYLTMADLHKIAAAGDEIGGLSVEHIPLTRIPVPEAQREICNDRVNLSRWGFRVTDFAYPYAEVTPALQDVVRHCGYNSALGTGQLRGAGLCQGCAWAETIPPANPYVLRAPIEVASVGTTWSPATFEDIVTGSQRHGGGWIIFTIHDVCAKTCPLGVTVPELNSVLGWLARQATHGVSVRTVRQVIGGPLRPAVAGPVPRPIRFPGVVNSRLSLVGADGIPACFQRGSYGHNHAAFSYRRAAGPGGAGAEVISLRQRRSGTAQLITTLDLGACAPEVAPGQSYALGAWYRSSAAVMFNVYYRNVTGTWTFWLSSPPLPAERGWTHVSWTTPDLPSRATALSFGLALRTDGTMATSRYSLSPAQPAHTGLIAFGAIVGVLGLAVVAIRRYPLRW